MIYIVLLRYLEKWFWIKFTVSHGEFS